MILEFPLRLHSVLNARGHWRLWAKITKSQRTAVGWRLKAYTKPAIPCVVTLTRISPRQLDGDNLQGAFKAVRDQVAEWIGIDDGSPLIQWRYEQRKGKPKEHAIAIEV